MLHTPNTAPLGASPTIPRHTHQNTLDSSAAYGFYQGWHKHLNDQGETILGLKNFWTSAKKKGLKWAPAYDEATMDEILSKLQDDANRLPVTEVNSVADSLTNAWFTSEYQKVNKFWQSRCAASDDPDSLGKVVKELNRDFAEHELRARVEWAISGFIKVRTRNE